MCVSEKECRFRSWMLLKKSLLGVFNSLAKKSTSQIAL